MSRLATCVVFQSISSLNDESVYYSILVVVVSHIQRTGYQPEKTTSHGDQPRSWSAEQGKENKKQCLAAPSIV